MDTPHWKFLYSVVSVIIIIIVFYALHIMKSINNSYLNLIKTISICTFAKYSEQLLQRKSFPVEFILFWEFG